jgi:ElaB/YqjD/DUF883 family membrane-anchored ribosome-binding protein
MNKHQEDIKLKRESSSRGESHTYTHPSYGMVRVSRCNGDVNCFGSEIKNSSYMTLQISQAEVTQDLGKNWYHSDKKVCEVRMTPVQYAELISNPNTQGVPCTLEYTQELGRIEYNPISSVTKYSEDRIFEEVERLKKEMGNLSKEISSVLDQKGTLKKADKDSVKGKVSQLVQTFNSDLPFYEEQLTKAVDRQKLEAKAEMESYLSNIITRTGLEVLKDPNKIAMLTNESNNTGE